MSNTDKLKQTAKEVRPNAIWDIIKWIFQQIKEWGWLSVLGYPVTLIWQWLYNIPVTFQALIVLGVFWTILAIIFGTIRHFRKSRRPKDANGNNPQENLDAEKSALEAEKQLALSKVTDYEMKFQESEKKLADLLVLSDTEEKLCSELLIRLNTKEELYQRLQQKSEDDKIFYENQHKSILQKLKTEHQAQIENLKSEHRKEISNWQTHEKNLQIIIDDSEAKLRHSLQLIERGDRQSKNIEDFVKLDKFFFNRVEKKPIPHIVFTFLMKNKSLFDVTLLNEIQGHIEFNGQILQGKTRFYQPPEIIPSVSHKWFTFEYRLSREEYDFIVSFSDPNEFEYDISKLILTIIEADNFYKINRKQVKIRRGFKVWDYKEYEKAQDKFQQQEN